MPKDSLQVPFTGIGSLNGRRTEIIKFGCWAALEEIAFHAQG